MLAIRLHLDPCGADNGPVRVINGTHRLGRLAPDAIDRLRAEQPESECLAAEGALLAFRPLLLHASSPAVRAGHRRVIHIEYAARPLAHPLVWHHQVA
jgi:ectoine hydroxylase-related dioxygenase (phytanoyl-CoA dioxygenase family)